MYTGDTMSRTSEADLVEVYAAHRLQLVRLATLLVDDVGSAQDVVQDVVTAMLAKPPRLRDPDALLGYMRTAVVNRSRSALRRRRTARGYVPDHVPDAPDASSGALLAEEHREMLDAVRRLPPRQQEVLVLRYWSDLAEADIAEALGISRGTVRSTNHRALANLQHILTDPTHDPEADR